MPTATHTNRPPRKLARHAAIVLLSILAGVALGRFAPWPAPRNGDAAARPDDSGRDAVGAAAAAHVWTCSMHPQIRMPAPGICPLCGMDLVPAKAGAASGPLVELSESAQRVASIEVEAVRRQPLAYSLRTVGRVVFAEPDVANLTARVSGRVERVYADTTGVEVASGDHLVDIYSPELVVAQEEFLLALRALAGGAGAGQQSDRDRARLELSRQKLRLLGVSEAQLQELQTSGKPAVILTVHAPIGGTLVTKQVREQAYVKTGDPLYEIADLARVWVLADVYEYELPWVDRGQPARLSFEALPGESFEGVVAFVDPRVDESSRTIKVRIDLDNSSRHLKPGMFAHVTIRAELDADGRRVPSLLAGKLACPMHPEVVSDSEGTCPKCGMALVRVGGKPAAAAKQEPAKPSYSCPMHPDVVSDAPGACPRCKMSLEIVAPAASAGLPLSVPSTAVLALGTRTIVWVERGPGKYELAVVVLGPRADDRYPVLEGLKEGDRVVVRGNFLLDSQAQIEGKPSLLFPTGLESAASARSEHAGH